MHLGIAALDMHLRDVALGDQAEQITNIVGEERLAMFGLSHALSSSVDEVAQ